MQSKIISNRTNTTARNSIQQTNRAAVALQDHKINIIVGQSRPNERGDIVDNMKGRSKTPQYYGGPRMSQFPQITGVDQDIRTFNVPTKTIYPTSF